MSVEAVSNWLNVNQLKINIQKYYSYITAIFFKVLSEKVTWKTPIIIGAFAIVWIKHNIFFAASYLLVAYLAYNVGLLVYSDDGLKIEGSPFATCIGRLYQMGYLNSEKVKQEIISSYNQSTGDYKIFCLKLDQIFQREKIAPSLLWQIKSLFLQFQKKGEEVTNECRILISQEAKIRFINGLENVQTNNHLTDWVKNQLIEEFNYANGILGLFENALYKMKEKKQITETVLQKVRTLFLQALPSKVINHDFIQNVSDFSKLSHASIRGEKESLFIQTKKAAKQGFFVLNKIPCKLFQRVKLGVSFFSRLPGIIGPNISNGENITVLKDDLLNVALWLKNNKYKPLVCHGLNLAEKNQSEIVLRTNYFQALSSKRIRQNRVFFSKNVQIFRECAWKGYAFTAPEKIDLVSWIYPKQKLQEEAIKESVRKIFRIAYLKRYKCLVFDHMTNTDENRASLFKEVLKEREFLHKFKQIFFVMDNEADNENFSQAFS